MSHLRLGTKREKNRHSPLLPPLREVCNFDRVDFITVESDASEVSFVSEFLPSEANYSSKLWAVLHWNKIGRQSLAVPDSIRN